MAGPARHAVADPSPASGDAPVQSRLDAARQQARGLRKQVDDLEVRAALAAEDQEAATTELGRVIGEEVAAEADLDRARQAATDQRAQASRRARALYISGGHTRMVAAALSSSLTNEDAELGDVLSSMRTVQTLVGDDATGTARSRDRLDEALAASTRVQETRAERQQLEASAAEATTRLQAAVDQQQALLAEADGEVVALVQEQREQEEQEALARAAEVAAALGVPTVGVPTAPGGAGGGTGAGTVAPAPTAQAQAAVDAAVTMLGRPYRWGAVGPDSFDCSGLTAWAYRQAGIVIPRTSRQQYAALPKVPLAQLQPGDLVFFAAGNSASSIHHVGIYVGGGRMLHAPRTGDVVKISALWQSELYGAARPVPSP
ncbi:MAG: NlpC/P60 family protein [Actinomycetes bacterium]